MTIKIIISDTLSSRFKEQKQKQPRGSFVSRKAVCGEEGSVLPVQQLRLGWTLEMFWRRTDAQFLPQGCQGLLPTLLIVDVEGTRGPAPVLNRPRDQLREQYSEAPGGGSREKKSHKVPKLTVLSQPSLSPTQISVRRAPTPQSTHLE